MNIEEIFEDKQKACITRGILEALPEWFEIPEGREKYIKDSCGKKFVCAYDEDRPMVFYIFHKRGKIHLNLQLWVSERNIIEWALEKNFLKEPDILHKKKGLVLYK